MKGEQPPREGCGSRLVREVKVTASAQCPMIGVRAGSRDAKPSAWLVDSGAGESILDGESFKEGFPGVCLQPLADDIRFRTADGSPLQVTGSFITELWFGSYMIQARIYVCKGVTRTRLIGGNILSQVPQWGVDNKQRNFIFGEVRIPLISTAGEPPRICEVRLKNDVEVPSRCSMFVAAELPQRCRPSEMIFRPDGRMFSKHNLLVPICLVANDFFDGTVRVKITNPSNEAVRVHKGTKLGKVSDDVDEFEWVIGGNKPVEIGINRLQASSKEQLIEDLRKEHEELYKLYMLSLKELNESEQTQLLQLLWKYRGVFSVDDNDLGTTNIIKHKIVPKSNKVVYRRQYRHSEEQHRQIDEEVQKLLDAGVIRESMSPYNSPVLMVPKAEKGKWRFCLDCRYINDLTEDQYFPIPRIDDVLDSLSGAEIFSCVDCTSGYHQVDLDEETSEMCAFSTRKGHYQYMKLPMGLRGSGMTFQKMVTLLLSGMLHTEALAYLDDCVLFSKSISQHMGTLEEVLKRFSDANLKLKPRKCQLFRSSIVYLGYRVDKKGIRPNPEATQLIRSIEEPRNVTEVQMFLGKANYYRKFVPKLAEIAHPLYELIRSKGKCAFQWEAEHQAAFDQVKTILCSGQVMGHPRMDKEFILDVDASDFALGAELSQEDEEGNLRPVYHASRHLEKAECNYSATARETLAAVFGCEYFRQYLQGKKFILRSDHNPLVWLRAMKEPKRPYSGWIVRLEQFNYLIQYRPGRLHVNADFNSRVGAPEGSKGSVSRATQTETEAICSIVTCTGEDSAVSTTSNLPGETHKDTDHVVVSRDSSNSSFDSGCDKTTIHGATLDREVAETLGSAANSGCDKTTSLKTTPNRGCNKTPSAVNGGCDKTTNPDHTIPDRGCDKTPSATTNLKATLDRGCDKTPVMDKMLNSSSSLVQLKDAGVTRRSSEEIVGVKRVEEHPEEVDVPTVEVVSEQQKRDQDIGPVIERLQGRQGVKLTRRGEQLWRKRGKLGLLDGLLIRYHQLKGGLSSIEQVVLPGCMRQMVMESLHDSEFAGHFGVKRTLARVKLRYYWPGYMEDVEEWCKTCVVCQERKPPPNKNVAPLTSIDTGQGPFEQVALDILKLPRTERGNQYLLVIEDYFSKWIEAFPLQRTIAPSVAQCVLNGWIARFGCPFTILSDQGPEFSSKLFQSLNKMLQVKKLRTTTYHPRTDGMVERTNRTMIDIMSKYAEGEPDWDLKLPLVLFAIRTSEHATTGFSPFALTYGCEARLPWDILYGPVPNTPTPLESWVADRKLHMTKVFQMVKEHTGRRQLQQKEFFDKSRSGKFSKFQVGELVLYFDPACRSKEGKLNRPWSGPHRVTEKVSDSLYVVELGPGKEKMVNAERIKTYHGRMGWEAPQPVPHREEEEEDSGDDIELREVYDNVEQMEGEAGQQVQPAQGEDIHQALPVQAGRQPIQPQAQWDRGQYLCNLDPVNIVEGKRVR